MKKPLYVSAILSGILFASLLFFSFISTSHSPQLFYARITWYLVISYTGFSIYRTGAVSRYRSILFILIAFFFFLEFKFFRLLSFEKTIPPYCHIAQAPTIFNFFHSQFLAVTSNEWRVWGVLSLGFLWLLMMFTIGQGICSWVCFYGGIDEACSKVAKRPVLDLRISKKWRDFPIAFLIFLLIVSFLQGLPVFCSWFCPFKFTTHFWDSVQSIRLIQISLFVLLLGVFVILLPILTKKRTFCSLVCPFGALVSICGSLSPYRVTIDKDKCTLCKICQKACPVFAIDDEGLNKYKISSYCNRCGACMDICPTKAITVTVFNNLRPEPFFRNTLWRIDTRDIFIFIALLITGVISGPFVSRVIVQVAGLR